MTNFIDKAIEAISPEAALRRETARHILKAQRAYEAAQPSRLRKTKTDPGSGDTILERAGVGVTVIRPSAAQRHPANHSRTSNIKPMRTLC